MPAKEEGRDLPGLLGRLVSQPPPPLSRERAFWATALVDLRGVEPRSRKTQNPSSSTCVTAVSATVQFDELRNVLVLEALACLIREALTSLRSLRPALVVHTRMQLPGRSCCRMVQAARAWTLALSFAGITSRLVGGAGAASTQIGLPFPVETDSGPVPSYYTPKLQRSARRGTRTPTVFLHRLLRPARLPRLRHPSMVGTGGIEPPPPAYQTGVQRPLDHVPKWTKNNRSEMCRYRSYAQNSLAYPGVRLLASSAETGINL